MIHNYGVTVYTKPHCVNCTKVKRALTANNVPFAEAEIDEQVLDFAKREGIRQAPIVSIQTENSEYYSGGYDKYTIEYATSKFGDAK